MMTTEFEFITKIEAAERQLCAAIRMFFEEADMLAVHTVATAAQQILMDLGQPRGFFSVFDDEALVGMRYIFRASQNFLKHADRDPDAHFPFPSEATKFHLLDGCFLVSRITRRMRPEVAGFLAWFFHQFPNLFDTRNVPELATTIDMSKRMKNFDRFEDVLSEIDRMAVQELFQGDE